MRIEPQLGGASIVLVGSFNPAIFHPQWLARHELVSWEEADAATVPIAHPEFVQFQVSNFSLTTEMNKFTLERTQAPWISLADFVSRLFGEILPHTPVRQFGINRSVHFGVGDEETRNKIGRTLAPPASWGAWGEEIIKSPAALRGGMSNVSMYIPWTLDDFRGRVSASVQPSSRITGNSGIFVQVNDHVEYTGKDGLDASLNVVRFLASRFDDSMARSESIIDDIMALKDKVK